ncbi:hypothetical protein [Lysobacter brunescens]|uniref:Uncharacterized protein n=1 Tax=Lysobacter brunescens TaxID=262323 RepID=A0ABW2YBL1_9GAMM
MTPQQPISPELRARIDALTDDRLKANILRVLNSPGNQSITNEQIFENMVSNHARVVSERAKWRQWEDDEVRAFAEYFKKEAPEDFAEYLRQEKNNGEIESLLSWRVRHLSSQWIEDLDFHDRTLLLGKLRDHMQALTRAHPEDPS